MNSDAIQVIAACSMVVACVFFLTKCDMDKRNAEIDAAKAGIVECIHDDATKYFAKECVK